MAATEPRLSQLPFIKCSNDDKPDGSKSEAQQRKPISVAIPKHKAHDILNIPSSLVTPPVSRTASSFDLPHISPPNKQSATSKAAQAHLPPQKLPPLPNVTCVVRARIPTTSGTEIFLHLYQNDSDTKEHLAIVFGNRIRSRSLDAVREGETEMDRMIRGAYTGKLYPGRTSSTEEQEAAEAAAKEEKKSEPPLVRIHSECYTGETAWSARCDCGEQLDEAARLMGLEGEGVIVYLRQEGRGIGLSEKLKAYNLQDLGNDTVEANLLLRHPADARTYGLATAILCDLDCNQVCLLTNNPDKVAAVEGPNKEVEVVSRVAMVPKHWRGEEGGVKGKEVGDYLRTKIEKMGHMLGMPEQ